MITVTETQKRTLETPEEIATYLQQAYNRMSQESPFQTGEVVAITKRAGLPTDIGIGDIAMVLCDLPGQPWVWVLVLNNSGAAMPAMVPGENLGKRDTAEGGKP